MSKQTIDMTSTVLAIIGNNVIYLKPQYIILTLYYNYYIML